MDVKIDKIFSDTLRLCPSYHGWPTVVNTGNDKLMAVCSGNREAHICPFGRVYLYQSDDGGLTWTGPRKLTHGPLDERDAGICRVSDNILLVNYFTNILSLTGDLSRAPETWRRLADSITLKTLNEEHGFWMIRSEDNGATWSDKYSIPVNNPHGPALMRDGSLLFVGRRLSHANAYLDEGSRLGNTMAVTRSTDQGRTWQVISELPVLPHQTPLKCFEPYAVQTDDGALIAHFRNQNTDPIQTWQTESADDGLTWTPPHPVSCGYPSHLLRLPSGGILMSYGYRHQPYGIRCRLSEDGGGSWSKEIILADDGKDRDLGYPSSVLMSDGSIFTLWYQADGSTAHLRYCRWALRRNNRKFAARTLDRPACVR